MACDRQSRQLDDASSSRDGGPQTKKRSAAETHALKKRRQTKNAERIRVERRVAQAAALRDPQREGGGIMQRIRRGLSGGSLRRSFSSSK